MMMLQRAFSVDGFLLLVVALLGCTSIQGARYPNLQPVEIDPDKQVAVRLGQSQTILCRMAVPLLVCRFDIPEEGSLILTPNQPSDDGIEYFGDGLKSGQCGVKIKTVREKHDGLITCSLTPENGRTESRNSIKLVVARPPSAPRLILNKHEPYKSGEKMEVSCIAEDGRPPANVSLFLDNESIGEDRYSVYGLKDSQSDENRPASLNTSRGVEPSDHGKTLRCVASHVALQRPLETTRQIEVHFSPQPQDTIHRFGYAIGRPGKVNVTVHANPRPTFTWIIGDTRVPAGQPDNTNRLQASSAQDLGRGLWSVELTIDSVQKSDTEKDYSLEANNGLGVSKYKIVLSSASEPPAGVGLDAGSIIGIIVGALALILLVFLIIFARATGRWCFADDMNRRNIGESSDTESTGRFSRTEVDSGKNGRGIPKISFSQLFKRNKDKVSGADTDTVRTIVTMDDEKIPVSEVTTTTETPAVGHEDDIVYAELVHQQQLQAAPRVINEDKTEYAEILYPKPDGQPQDNSTTDK